MEKRVFAFLFILVLSFSLISAFSFNDFWKKITGQAAAEDKDELCVAVCPIPGVYDDFDECCAAFEPCKKYDEKDADELLAPCIQCIQEGKFWINEECVEDENNQQAPAPPTPTPSGQECIAAGGECKSPGPCASGTTSIGQKDCDPSGLCCVEEEPEIPETQDCYWVPDPTSTDYKIYTTKHNGLLFIGGYSEPRLLCWEGKWRATQNDWPAFLYADRNTGEIHEDRESWGIIVPRDLNMDERFGDWFIIDDPENVGRKIWKEKKLIENLEISIATLKNIYKIGEIIKLT